ncbi:carboxypeptidase N subunit 2-like isoform X2 [Ptychodera flava]|uniref:carboxypeptidase N subunit 2-like isoform X2 n=1 Tax=Ptychodera flava TaxID=63121 RepID=UPI00396A0BFE
MDIRVVALCTAAVLLLRLSSAWDMHYTYFKCEHDCSCYDEYYVYGYLNYYFDHHDRSNLSDSEPGDNDTTYSYYSAFSMGATENNSTWDGMTLEGTYVDCRSRNLRTVRANWAANVTVLKLSHNRLTHLPGGGFSNYQQLHQLHLDFNTISRVHVNAFANLNKLYYISMSYNNLTVIPVYTFSKLTSLGYVRLDHNNLKRIPLVRTLSNLVCLTVSSNQLDDLDGADFSDQANLHTLDIRRNKFERLSTSLATFLNKNTMEPYGYVYIGENPYICDCGISVLKTVWPKHPMYLQDSVYCAYPEHLRDENIWHIPDSFFVCDNTTRPGHAHIGGEIPEERAAVVFSGVELAGASVGFLVLGIVLSGTAYLGFIFWKRLMLKKDSDSRAFVKMEETGQ